MTENENMLRKLYEMKMTVEPVHIGELGNISVQLRDLVKE